MQGETFKVEAKVTITSNVSGYSGHDQAISYDQTFNVPARSFAEVAKILGAFNDAMDGIKPDHTQRAVNEAYNRAVKDYGRTSVVAQTLEPFIAFTD